MGEELAIPSLLSLIFLALALLHLLWACGMKWGLDGSVPSKPTGEKVFKPTRFDCLLVGMVLGAFAAFYILSLFQIAIASNLYFLNWIAPIIFALRLIGDFRYFGIFKKVKSTLFGKMDSYFIIPLCLIIVVLGAIVAT